MKNFEGDYFIGLDLGTSSVGWAVTDTQYHILRAKGKDLWGVRLFDEANTAANRRSNRVNRRRRFREKVRISLLQELLMEEINKVDPGFFHRLEESKFWLEDRTGENTNQKYAIFAKGSTGERDYTDVDYYRQYPTIFHLRSELAHDKQPHDIRLLYLALLNMFKHRGHFLNESLGTDGEAGLDDAWKEFLDSYGRFVDEMRIEDEEDLNNVFAIQDKSEIICVLLQRGISKSQIREEAAGILGISKGNKRDYQILSLLCGLASNLEDIFGKEAFALLEDKSKKNINFRKSAYDEDIAEIQEFLTDDGMALLLSVKAMHDVLLLENIMQGQVYLCDARVMMYDQHKEDLRLLKHTIKRLLPEEYSGFFRKMQDGNYSSYVGSTNSDKENGKVRRYVADHATAKRNNEPDELYGTIKKMLVNYIDDPEVADILKKIDSEVFLRKQLTSANGVIPNQIYVREMKAILKNAEMYFPFLKAKDESGLSVSERILALFQFRIPYFIGPIGGLSQKSANKWAVRRSGESVTPWNIGQVIDMDQTRQAFIENLIRHCTYLQGEKVLPKHSLLYEKFMVLNELNNIKIAGEPITVEMKQDIYNSLFMKGKTVTLKKLSEFLVVRGVIEKGEEGVISGIEDRFNSSLTSIGKFNGVFEPPYLDIDHTKMIEDIILLGTIYGDSKKTFVEQIRKKYALKEDGTGALSEKQIKRISGFRFSGWGRCSRAFFELEGTSKADGVVRTVINALWETNDNLMQLLSPEKYTYSDNLNALMKRQEKKLADWTIDDLDGMYLSAPVKRMVWQTLRVLREIQDIMGRPPKRVFVEMIRENQIKKIRPKSRKSQLIELYKNSDLKKEQRKWISKLEGHSEQEFRIKKLYLYYCQMGRCMYTGEPIDLEQLMNDNIYDIDHIYPRHFVKDDSLDKNLVLVKKEKNNHKQDKYPIESDIQAKCWGMWNDLLQKKLISKEKYDRLVRKSEFTIDERAAFVQRQIVETGQGTKAITQILQESLSDNTEVVFSKAGAVSQFRQDKEIWKCRSVNDFHHAYDAYLNIVVGNVYFTKFTKNPMNFIKESVQHSQDERYKYHLSKMFDYSVRRGEDIAWIAEKDCSNNSINVVKSQVIRNTPLISRRSYVATGAITSKDTYWGRQKTSNKALGTYFPSKTSDPRLSDVTKYGGKSGISTSAYSLLYHKEGNNEIRSIEAIPLIMMKNGRIDSQGLEKLLSYYKDMISNSSKKPCSDFRILYPVIMFNSLMRIDGYYYYIGGKSGNSYYLYNAVPLKLAPKEVRYVKKIDKAVMNNDYEERDSEKLLVITKKQNEELFGNIVEKLNQGIFLNRKGGLLSCINEGKENFGSLDVSDQCKVLRNVILSFAATTQNVDLSLIGGSPHVGTVLLSKNIGKLMECVLIQKSVTGIFETETDLLKL